MATSLVREGTLCQKKTKSYFADTINEGTDNGDVAVAGGDFLLGYLPPNCIITAANIHVVTASDAVTSSTGTLGTTEGGSEILSAADLKSAGDEGTFTGESLTGTGKPLYLGITKVGGNGTAVGETVVVVEYLEYTKKSGEYTTFDL